MTCCIMQIFSGGFYTYNFKLSQSTEYKRFENAIVWYQKLKNGNEVFTEIGKLDPTEQDLVNSGFKGKIKKKN